MESGGLGVGAQIEPVLQQLRQLLLLRPAQPRQLGWWRKQPVARSAQGGGSSSGEPHGLYAAVGCRRLSGSEAGALEIVDHRGDVGRVAVQSPGELTHRLLLIRIDREEGAQSGLGYPEFASDLGPPEALLQDETHQLMPGLNQEGICISRLTAT